jgi:hypothetical protein
MNAAVPIEPFTNIDVRTVWPHEAVDFTPWLAQHLDYLTNAIGLELEVEATEVAVGAFRVDIKAREVGTDAVVIVENQLESTNHNHLGQLLTYAAGLESAYVVWIATTIRAEHRTALRWLNENTTEGFGFFGIELETVKIDVSPVAVRLNVVERPDDWAKSTQAAGKAASPKELLYQEFWQGFLEQLHERLPAFSKVKSPPRGSWLSMSAGRSGIAYSVNFTSPDRLRAELYVDASDEDLQQARWAALFAQRQAIDKAWGSDAPALEWEPLPERRASRIATYREGVLEARESWTSYQDWMIGALDRLRGALDQHVKNLDG